MDGYGELGYWKKQSDLWKHKYEELQATLYYQWARNQRQHEELMKKAAAELSHESEWKNKYEKLERQHERLEKSLEAHFIDKKLYDQNVDELIAHKDHQYDYIQKLEDENAQLRAELKRENE